MSKRLLVLGDKYARLICEHELFLEEFIADSSGCSRFRTDPYANIIRRFEFLDGPWWFVYNSAVRAYTLRDLTFQEDIISAFEGVADVLQAGTATTFIFNLPDTEMDEALLWYPSPWVKSYEGELRRSSGKSRVSELELGRLAVLCEICKLFRTLRFRGCMAMQEPEISWPDLMDQKPTISMPVLARKRLGT